MELQEALPELERSGTTVFAISYDPVDVLAHFAEQREINFSLLSDEGSRAIEALGLLNQHIAEQQAFYGMPVSSRHQRLPYPGTFVLDEQGVVVGKHFEQSYRHRPTVGLAVEQARGEQPPDQVPTGAPTARAAGEGIAVTAWLDAPTYRAYQRLRLHLAFRLGPGVHLYGVSVPEGYTPLTIELGGVDGLRAEPAIVTPAPHPFKITGLDEAFVVHEGDVRATVPFAIEREGGGRATLVVRLAYQACDETTCYPPNELTLELPLEEVALVRD